MKNKSDYCLRPDGAFVIENYNNKKPFSNFFPGIAGMHGIPMWVFYTNRGQGISSFGIESKDKSIVEFQPANKAYRLTTSHGFRTFIKVKMGGRVQVYEPFKPSKSTKIKQTMAVSSHELTITEVNTAIGLSISVTYFTIPEEPFASLARILTVTNISKEATSIEIIDGLPLIIPYGQNDWVMKNMCRTIEAWYKVRNIKNKAPYYQLDVEAADTPQVNHIEEGNFYFAFNHKDGNLLKPIIETSLVFGHSTDYATPETFVESLSFKIPFVQQSDNRTPSAMSYCKCVLKPSASQEIVSMTGFAHSVQELNALVKRVTVKGFINFKREQNRLLIEGIKDLAFTNSAYTEFNAYAGQTFLDNVLRGGLPVSLKTGAGNAVFNVYSRKHGDPERDYNAFKLAPTFLSQGNGNYRDVNQNRRNDVWFNSDLKETAVVNFLSLIQADGYNPLVVCGMSFIIQNEKQLDALLKSLVKSGEKISFKLALMKGFMPGELFGLLNKYKIELNTSSNIFLGKVLGICQKYESAQHGEGFWTDHWTYNLDLIESYLSLYPEKLCHLLLENREYTFFNNSVYVKERDCRYVLTPRGVRQYHSLHEAAPNDANNQKLRTRNGKGSVYTMNLLTKLLSIIVNKAASLDPSGIGIEMEANKPGWYDSLNGLPGLIGSSINETLELKRLASFLIKSLQEIKVNSERKVPVYEELAQFIHNLKGLLKLHSSEYDYWNKSNQIKEVYRKKIRNGISGVEKNISISEIYVFLQALIVKIDEGLKKATRKDGLFPTYFYHNVVKYELVKGATPAKEGPFVRPLRYERNDMPLFLEGFVHAMRCEQNNESALKLHKLVEKSALFDRELKMYKVNENIKAETEEIGRTRVFPRGWLENESIWLHMEYKYLLEILRAGLYDEYYKAFETCCVAFMSPEKYGRSILENSSFIVSSAHNDKALHGQGFVARLSGSTAEFVHMWMYMNVGIKPFTINSKGQLELTFAPVLKGEYFTREKSHTTLTSIEGKVLKIELPANTYAFNFMGKTLVVYHNPQRKDTFGKNKNFAVSYVLRSKNGKKTVLKGAVIPEPFSKNIRDGQIVRIDVRMG